MAEDSNWKAYKEAARKIDARVAEAVRAAGQQLRVDYSASENDENDVPIDNLDEVAVPGKVVLTQERDTFYGGPKSRSYRSVVLENPTWLQVAVCANEMIKVTRDHHHVFLEGLDKKGEERTETGEVITIYEFSMGS